MNFESHIQQRWYGRPGWLCLLLPFELIYQLIVALRRFLFRLNILRSEKIAVPIVVVGNIAVGGTGKTPVVIALCAALKQAGFHPGIISRGYGAEPPHLPFAITADSRATEAGDEPLLLALNTHCPVVIAPNRVAAANYLLEHNVCDVIISDDGLQHYRLRRDIELAVIDSQRGVGNGHCLPVGPLRETIARLDMVDAVLVNSVINSVTDTDRLKVPQHAFYLRPKSFVALHDRREIQPAQWASPRVHAVAGIGNPDRFFSTLKSLGLTVIEHPFPDHHNFAAADLQFGDGLPIVMTEKDAVKCIDLDSGLHECWYLAVEAVLPESLIAALLGRIASLGRSPR